MKKPNTLSKAILTALTLGVCSSNAGTYYIPHAIERFDPVNNETLTHMSVVDLNNNGEMVGMVDEGRWAFPKAVYWSSHDQAQMLPIPPEAFPHPDPWLTQMNKTYTRAYGINDAGVVVGFMHKYEGDYPYYTSLLRQRAVEWTKTGQNNAYELQYNDNSDHHNKNALVINNLNQIGLFTASLTEFDLKTNGTMQTIDAASAFTGNHVLWPEAINDNGIVSLSDSHNLRSGALYDSLNNTFINTSGNSGNLLYGATYKGINNNNEVVGSRVYYDNAGEHHQTLCHYANYFSGTVDYEFDAAELFPATGEAGCYLNDINNTGKAVGRLTGFISIADPIHTVGFIMDTADGDVTDIRTRLKLQDGQTMENFNALLLTKINDGGAIVGYNGHPPTLVLDSSGNHIGWRTGDHENDIYYYFEPHESEQIVDNDAGYSSNNWVPINYKILFFVPDEFNKHWVLHNAPGNAYNDDYLKAQQNGEQDKHFSWELDVPVTTSYTIKAQWLADISNDQNAIFEIRSNGNLMTTVTADQTQGSGFQSIATVNFQQGDRVKVTLKGSGTGNLIADAIKMDFAD